MELGRHRCRYVSVLQPLHARRVAVREHSGFEIADDRAAVEAFCMPEKAPCGGTQDSPNWRA